MSAEFSYLKFLVIIFFFGVTYVALNEVQPHAHDLMGDQGVPANLVSFMDSFWTLFPIVVLFGGVIYAFVQAQKPSI